MEAPSCDDSPTLTVIKLLRVSSEEQEKGAGLDTQDRIISRELNSIEEETEIVEEISEKGISGTNFPRESLTRILNIVRQQNIDCVAVKDVSRVGRLAGPTFGFIWLLNTRFNVDLITEDGRFNVHHKTDLIQMFFDSLNAEMKNRFRTSYVVESQLESFRQGKFHVTGRKARFGYEKTVENGSEGTQKDENREIDQDERMKENQDVRINPNEAEVIKRIFEIVSEVGPIRNLFVRIKEKLNNEFDSNRYPNESTEFKKLLRNPIYKGKPTWEINLAAEETKTATMDRPDLAIVDSRAFDKVAKVLDHRDARHFNSNKTNNQSSTDQVSLQQLTSMVGLSRLVAFDDVVRIHCPDCGEEMYDNGKWRATSDIRPPNISDFPQEPILKRYKCPNEECERSEKRFPNEYEGYLLLNTEVPLSNLVGHV